MKVGVQRLVYVGADRIHGFGDIGDKPCQGRGIHALKHIQDGLPHGASHILGSQGRIGLDGGHQLGHLLGHGGAHLLRSTCHGGIQLALDQGSCILKHAALGVADEGDVAAVIQVGTRCTYIGEIVGQGNLAVVTGHPDLGPGLFQVFALLHGHLLAVGQCERLPVVRGGCGSLCRGCGGGQSQENYENTFFHMVYFCHFVLSAMGASCSMALQNYCRFWTL